MNMIKATLTILLLTVLSSPLWAADSKAKESKKEEKKEGVLVIGQNLNVGMPLNKAFALLGIPDKFTVHRGTEPGLDSIAVEYSQGVVIHALNKKNVVEEIEVLPEFKGEFDKGIKLGDKFNDLVGKFGMPHALVAQVARYPERGYYFFMKDEVIVSGKVFVKDSKIFDFQLINK